MMIHIFHLVILSKRKYEDVQYGALRLESFVRMRLKALLML